MAYGKLQVIKTVGEKPAFIISDKEGKVVASIPSLEEWLFRRIGKDVSLTYTDAFFQIADIEETRK